MLLLTTKFRYIHYKVGCYPLQSFVTKLCYVHYRVGCYALQNFVMFVTKSVVTHYKTSLRTFVTRCCYPLQSFVMTHYRVVCYALQNFVTSHNNRLLIDASIDASLGQVSITRVVAHYKVCCYPLQSFVMTHYKVVCYEIL